MKTKPLFFLEIVWLIVAVFCVLAGIRNTYFEEIKESYFFFIMAGISLFMYYYRRNQRKKFKKEE